MDRREFIKLAVAGVGIAQAGLGLLACGGGGGVSRTKNPLRVPSSDGGLLGFYKPSGPFILTAEPTYLEILPGRSTRMLTYRVGDYINPTIVLRKGDTLEVGFKNRIGEKSIIHWHGFRADWESDGHPYYAVEDGETYSYPPINIIDRSGTYFYHPHPHGRTGYQVYHGLAGMIIIEDDDEDALRYELDLRLGETDIPLVIQDKTFYPDGSLRYDPMGMNGAMGFWGERVLVNLTPDPFLEVERRIYRFRLLNASNTRPYRLVLLKGGERRRFWVIGVEGGLLESPQETREILIAPGERVDILIDFREDGVGDVLRLYNLPHNLVGMGNGMGMELINGEFEVLEFRVLRDTTYTKDIPPVLSTIDPIDTTSATKLTIPLTMQNGRFTIDGKTWDENNALADYGYNFSNGDVIVIEFINETGMFHPMHLHGFQFQIIRRNGNGDLRPTDLGWKDTVIVGPNESVEIAVDMSHNFGREQVYLLHCHILEHHDAGMMVNYRVINS